MRPRLRPSLTRLSKHTISIRRPPTPRRRSTHLMNTLSRIQQRHSVNTGRHLLSSTSNTLIRTMPPLFNTRTRRHLNGNNNILSLSKTHRQPRHRNKQSTMLHITFKHRRHIRQHTNNSSVRVKHNPSLRLFNVSPSTHTTLLTTSNSKLKQPLSNRSRTRSKTNQSQHLPLSHTVSRSLQTIRTNNSHRIILQRTHRSLLNQKTKHKSHHTHKAKRGKHIHHLHPHNKKHTILHRHKYNPNRHHRGHRPHNPTPKPTNKNIQTNRP